MRKLWHWQDGRQGTGYRIFTMLNSQLLNMDCHLIRYGVGSSIPPHVDPVIEGYGHFRLNIELKAPKKGGELVCEKSLFRWRGINYFRPDLVTHSVTKVEEGVRYVLSIGWKRKLKQ
ncbi:hypothetical protein [Ralstonia phage RP31]|uniref:2OG-Fe(II) oxygenase n=2 Tax=Ripduovirus RP12 TaxID=2560700 RepID=A0A1L7N0V4_9CAUD|nr:hypothetical protein FDH28_gp126 [Ralstonia phage RP12]BAW19100.1 hypothetical protein [Ralstonia phage RP12]BAW19386.1 hypothetical protein [Ralstonia phage RP31]